MKDYLTKKIGKPLTPPKAFIDWCHAQLPIYEWKNNQETLRSSNRTNGFLIKKRLTKASKLTFSTKHDEAVNVFNQLKIELEEKAYRERLEKIKKLEQEIDEYMFLVPKKLEEIVEEGKNLNHCVGSYVEKHKTGETTIIFMRKKESQDQSLYTIEYKNKHIVQIQGYKNKEVIPEKVREVANKWVKKIS
ncbi:hypothetical protein EA82_02965 [Enterococcus hirae]|uniref:PcfJ domain-containing protein n=1 Tax=Enterococcus hirae TaxID=1354 RepID=UPI000DE93167|nr:PcfJ domain-containing protein [Enterococcus hirae]RBT65891.1 hypothetical protein EA82_02965 [Enterococcus hirae]